jgi:hypothetical protein
MEAGVPTLELEELLWPLEPHPYSTRPERSRRRMTRRTEGKETTSR